MFQRANLRVTRKPTPGRTTVFVGDCTICLYLLDDLGYPLMLQYRQNETSYVMTIHKQPPSWLENPCYEQLATLAKYRNAIHEH